MLESVLSADWLDANATAFALHLMLWLFVGFAVVMAAALLACAIGAAVQQIIAPKRDARIS